MSPNLRMESGRNEIVVGFLGVGKRQSEIVLPCLQAAFDDARSLTGGSRPPFLRLRSDKAGEFLFLHDSCLFYNTARRCVMFYDVCATFSGPALSVMKPSKDKLYVKCLSRVFCFEGYL